MRARVRSFLTENVNFDELIMISVKYIRQRVNRAFSKKLYKPDHPNEDRSDMTFFLFAETSIYSNESTPYEK